MLQPGVLLPVLRVDLAEAADDQLEFALVKGPQQVLRDQLVESLRGRNSEVSIKQTFFFG